MNHEQALEAMNEYAARNLPYFEISNEHLSGLVAAYLAARNAVVMPKELDREMAEVFYDVEPNHQALKKNAWDSIGYYQPVWAAIVAECERRDEHD